MQLFVKKLKSDNRVDQNSLERKIANINVLSQNDEGKKDFEAELWGAYHLLELSSVKFITFSETPDINFDLINGVRYGLEVKRIRKKTEDDEDEKRMVAGFVRYGKPRNVKMPWSNYIKSNVKEKAKKNYSTGDNTFLFLKSDSPHQIEKSVIEEGITKALVKIRRNPFIGIFYETVWRNSESLNLKILRPVPPLLLDDLQSNSYFLINK